MNKLTIYGRLPGLNEYIDACRKNRFAAAKLKRESEDLIIWGIRSQLKGICYDKKIFIEYHWFEKNKKRDPSNVAGAGIKFIEDAMIKAGTINNDGWNNIAGFTSYFYIDAQNPRIEVKIYSEKGKRWI